MERIIYSGLIYIQFKKKKLGCPICCILFFVNLI